MRKGTYGNGVFYVACDRIHVYIIMSGVMGNGWFHWCKNIQVCQEVQSDFFFEVSLS